MRNSIRIDFTAHFELSNSKSFNITNIGKLADTTGEKYEFATVNYDVTKYRNGMLVSFSAEGDHSDCVCATRCFLFTLMKSFKANCTSDYIEIHKILNDVVMMLNGKVLMQSIHMETPSGYGEVTMKAGLEIEKSNDMRLSDARRVLEPNDHYGNMFRICPNCREFEIPEQASINGAVKRCPCCGLKLIKW